MNLVNELKSEHVQFVQYYPKELPWSIFDAVVTPTRCYFEPESRGRKEGCWPSALMDSAAILGIGNVEIPAKVEDIWFTAKSGSDIQMILADLLKRRRQRKE